VRTPILINVTLVVFILIRMIQSSRTRWAGHVERMGRKRNAYRVLVGIQKEKDN
jgi:hypothetical protein